MERDGEGETMWLESVRSSEVACLDDYMERKSTSSISPTYRIVRTYDGPSTRGRKIKESIESNAGNVLIPIIGHWYVQPHIKASSG